MAAEKGPEGAFLPRAVQTAEPEPALQFATQCTGIMLLVLCRRGRRTDGERRPRHHRPAEPSRQAPGGSGRQRCFFPPAVRLCRAGRPSARPRDIPGGARRPVLLPLFIICPAVAARCRKLSTVQGGPALRPLPSACALLYKANQSLQARRQRRRGSAAPRAVRRWRVRKGD